MYTYISVYTMHICTHMYIHVYTVYYIYIYITIRSQAWHAHLKHVQVQPCSVGQGIQQCPAW